LSSIYHYQITKPNCLSLPNHQIIIQQVWNHSIKLTNFALVAKRIIAEEITLWGKIKKWLKRIFYFLLISHLVYVVVLRWVNPPITSTMLKSIAHNAGTKNGFERDYISYDEMGRNAKLAVLSAEDQLFPTHHGFDLDAIQKAIEFNNKSNGKKMRGASTISQQVAKNVFLWQGRDWIRKGLEVYFTGLIELVWGKKRILEMYLNVAEMGEGVFGIEAAAKHYFNKNANDLSKSEAAWIASILPNPVLLDIDNPTNKLENKHSKVQRFMNNLTGDEEIENLIK
jgi:monofunctional glycosyltransferase